MAHPECTVPCLILRVNDTVIFRDGTHGQVRSTGFDAEEDQHAWCVVDFTGMPLGTDVVYKRTGERRDGKHDLDIVGVVE
jgi:hypothetical protein